MAAGLPVIATQVGGIADFLFDAKPARTEVRSGGHNPEKPPTGWAVDPDSPRQIVEAVLDILAHPEKAKEVTATARKMVEETYDWDRIAKAMRERVFAPTLKTS